MEDVVIKDTLDIDGNLGLISYTGGNYFRSESGVDPNTLTPTIDANGFTLNVGTITDKMVFYYKTNFDVLERYLAASGKTAYQNHIQFEWGGGDNRPDERKTGTFTPLEAFQNNAIKSGSYNYQTQEFTWTLKANVNQNEIDRVVDTLDNYQDFKGTAAPDLEIYPLTVQPNGQLVRGDNALTAGYTANVAGKSLTITFTSPTTSAYEIVYKTKDSDGIIGTGNSGNDKQNKTYKNNAQIFLGNVLKGQPREAEVTVDVADNLIDKRGAVNSADSTIEWAVDINKSRSQIEGVTVKDALSSANSDVRQFYVKNSFKLAPYNHTANGVTLGEPVSIPGEDITFNSDGTTFEYILPESNPSYQLTYQTFYEGPNGETVTNSAVLNYTITSSGTSVSDESTKSEVNTQFVYNDSDAGMAFSRVDLEITKQGINHDDATKNKTLDGVEFTIWNKSGKFQVMDDVFTTNSEGKIQIPNIGTGTYVIKEKLPAGYVAPTTLLGASNIEVVVEEGGAKYAKYTVTVGNLTDAGTDQKTWTVNNDEVLQSVELTKRNNQSQSLQGVVFVLKKGGTVVTQDMKNNPIGTSISKGGETYNNAFETDASGKIYIPYLPVGNDYTFEEVATVPGYILDATPVSVPEIKTDAIAKVSQSVTNQPIKVTVENREKDKPTKKIEGSTFAVYKVNACPTIDPTDGKVSIPDPLDSNWTLVEERTTDSEGESEGEFEIDFTDSKYGAGTYVIVQKEANKYYVNRANASVTADCIEITPETPTAPIIPPFENERDRTEGGVGALTLTKELRDENGVTNTPIENAIIQLTGVETGNTYFGKTDEDGEIGVWYGTRANLDSKSTPVTTIVQDKYRVTELYTNNPNFAYEGLAKKVSAPGFTTDAGIVFDYDKITGETNIGVTNKKLLRTVIITNSCGVEATTYRLIGPDGNPVTHDALGNVIDGIDPTTGIITIEAGENKIQLEDLHLASGEYTVSQLTISPGCESGNPSDPVTVTPDEPGDAEFPEEDDQLK